MRKLACILSALAVVIVGPLATSTPTSARSAVPSAPRPGTLIETAVSSTAPTKQVKQTYVQQYAPLPASVPTHPARCDWLGYLRFRHADGPRDPAKADAVLVAQPGNLAGASHLDILARNVIRKAAERGRHVEFWALDRRSNCIEDRRGIRAAAKARDPKVAVDYYYRGKEIDGQRFEGFQSSADLPYLAEFGLAQTVRDEHDVIQRRVPQPLRKQKVFCGGHSHGGLITATFASWDFDGDRTTTADAGFNQCAGYFALDTLVDLDPAGVQRGGLAGNPISGAGYAATVAAIRSGALPRNETSISPLVPENMLLLTLAGLAGYQHPDQAVDPTLLPSTPNIELALRLFFSRDVVAFLIGMPNPRDFRLTYEALFGGLIDDNSQPLGFIQTSVGTFDGGPVAEKHFPEPSVARELLPHSPADTLFNKNRLMIPTQPKGPLYTWRSWDKVGAPDAPRQVDDRGRPFTSPESEVVDIHQWARASFEGPTDFLEWYMPTRLLTDTVHASLGARDGDLANLMHPDGPRKRPTVTILGGESLGPFYANDPGVYAQPPNRFVSVPGYNHADVTGPAWKQNNGKPELTTQALTGFVLDHAGHGG